MAAGSLKRINKFALGEARTHKKFFIISNIILGMGGLLYLFLSSYSSYETFDEDGIRAAEIMNFEPSMLGLFLIGVGSCIGLMGAASVFRDMNNIQLGDVQLSLPMTANERFFSKLLALFYIHVLPLAVWAGVPTLVHTFRCSVQEIDEGKYLPVIFMCFLAAALFINCVTVLCSVCCGALAESIYFTIIAVGCLSAAPILIWFNLVSTCAGQNVNPGLPFAAWTLSFFVPLSDSLDNTAPFNCMMMLNCGISLLVMALTSFIYARRDARSVGTPVANRVFFECMMFLGLSTVYGLFFFRIEAYIGIIIVAVIYIVIHIISSRGRLTAARFGGWLLKFTASTAAYILLAWAAYSTGGFGVVHYLPSDDFSEAQIEISTRTENRMNEYTATIKVGGKTDLSDAQVRMAAKLFQEAAAAHRISAGEFFSELNGYGSSNDEYYCDMSIVYGRRKDSRYPDGYRIGEDSMHQRKDLSLEEITQLEQKLEELVGQGLLKKETRNFGSEIDYTYVAD